MRRALVLAMVSGLSLMLGVIAAEQAADSSPLKTIAAVSAQQPIVLDGKLDDPAWKGAAEATPFVLTTGKGPAIKQTTAYLLHDDQALYVAFECLEPKMAGLVARCLERDGSVFSDDCVELFLDTNRDRQTYFHFAVNPLGTQSDEEGMDRTWDARWQAAAGREKDRWVVEMRIPFSELKLGEAVPFAWGINFNREEKQLGENSSWAFVGRSFHTPAKFGTVTGFQVGKAPTSEAIPYQFDGTISVADPRPGKNEAQIAIVNLTRVDAKRVQAFLSVLSDAKVLESVERAGRIKAGGTWEFTVPFNLPEFGRAYTLLLEIDSGPGDRIRVAAQQVFVGRVVVEPPDERIHIISHPAEDGMIVIAVNDRSAPAMVSYRVRDLKAISRVQLLGEGREIKAQGNMFTDRFSGYGVRVYLIQGR